MAKWSKTLTIFGVSLLMTGCQRLPEEPSPLDDDEPEGSTGFPSAEGTDSGLDSTSTGEGIDPTVCVPGLELSSFGSLAHFAGVEVFDGSLRFQELTDEDLSWFQCLREVRGDLAIVDSPGLTDLDGLQSLRSVEGYLSVRSTGIANADGLSNLRDVEELIFVDNAPLEQLDGLIDLETASRVEVTGHPLLTSLRLPLLTTTQTLVVSDNDALQDLDFTGISTIGHSLDLWRNPGITELGPLSGLEVVEGRVQIGHMDGLTTTAGLSSLRRVGTLASFSSNPVLERLELPSLEEAQTLAVDADPMLSAIDLPAIVSLEIVRLRHLDSLVDPPDLTGSSGLMALEVEDVAAMTTLDWVGTLPDPAGSVTLTDLPALTDLAPLVGVTDTLGSVRLTDLPALLSLEDLASLQAVDRDVALVDMPQLTTLLPLSSLSSISAHPNGAGLVVEGMDGLSSLEGLSSIVTLGGSLTLSDNTALSSIAALSSTTVTGSVTVSNNDQLTDLSGLEGLQSTNRNLIVEGNDALTSLTSLGGVSEIQILSIIDNDALTSLVGLETAQSVSQDMVITGNAALVSLEGLGGLESVGVASIVDNDALVSLDGLSGLRVIQVEFSITDNAVLSEFGGLWPTPVGAIETLFGPLAIQSNPMLSQCTVDDFVTALVDAGWPGMPQVGGNLRCAR